MEFSAMFPVWNKLTNQQQEAINARLLTKKALRGEIVHNGNLDCPGLMLLKSGQLRAHILSDEGREITIYRLFERDLCLLSASCVMNSILFDVIITAEKDTELFVIPPDLFRRLMDESAAMANFTNELMASRFSEVVWLMEQIMWKSMDRRVANFLLEEAALEETTSLKITHETIANHLGTHREVVTRMLRYFQAEGMVRLTRGTVELTDEKRLRELERS